MQRSWFGWNNRAGAITPREEREILQLITLESDVLITDVLLPGMSGDLLAAQARTQAPGIRIVFATGKGEVNNWLDAVVLRKPYDLQSLIRAPPRARRRSCVRCTPGRRLR